MNKKCIKALVVLLLIATSLQASEPTPQTWKDTFSGYWTAAQERVQNAKKWANENPRTAIIGSIGVATALILGYKWIIAKPSTPKIEIVPPNISAMKLFADDKSDYKAEKVADNPVEVPHWLESMSEIANEAYADLPKAEKDVAIKAIVKIAYLDPHDVLGEVDFMTRLDKTLILSLVGVFGEFVRDRIVKILHTLFNNKNVDQEGLLEMYKSLPNHSEPQLINLLRAYVSGGHLSKVQENFVSRELSKIEQWKDILLNFIEVYKIDEHLAQDPAFKKAMERALREAKQ